MSYFSKFPSPQLVEVEVVEYSRYPARINTPSEQIPLDLSDLHSLAHQIDVAIKTIEGFQGEAA